MKLALALTLFLLAPSLAHGDDWYVDASGGSNANSGTSPGDAWRTITHALQQIGAGPDTIHLLPGTYDEALGESFPLYVSDGQTLVGTTGPEHTHVRSSTSSVFLIESTLGITVEFRGLTVGPAPLGIHCIKSSGSSQCYAVSVNDVVFDGCTTAFRYEGWGTGFLCNYVTFEDVRVLGGQLGVDVDHSLFDDLELQFTDSTFVDQSSHAVRVSSGQDCLDLVLLDRCRIEGAAVAISTQGFAGHAYVDVCDSLIANCGSGVSTENGLVLAWSTLTGITNAAVSGGGTVRESILHDNGADLGPGSFSVSNTNLGGGAGPVGQNGNISEDPLFRDPGRGDYRPGWGTGCIDAVPPPFNVDITGFQRGNDGDLDLVGLSDMGAFELRTLDMPATLAVGTKLHVDYHAEVGQFGVLFLARAPQLPAPLATPFGDQWLPPAFLEDLGPDKALTPAPIRRTIYIPNSPALVGQMFSFQALSRSSNAPQGAAWTDAATVTFTL